MGEQTRQDNMIKQDSIIRQDKNSLKRRYKIYIINYLEKILLSSNISRKTTGILIRSFHNMLPLIIALLIVIGNKRIVQYCGIIIVILILMFYLFDGCILSMLENRICNDSYNIVDPILEIFNIEINYNNRMRVSYYILGIFAISYMIIYKIRFVI